MANYIVISCTSGEQSIISSTTTLYPNNIIDYYIGELGPYCGKVISVTLDTQEGAGGNHIYTDCCDCIQTEMDELISLEFNICGGDKILIELSGFCTTYGDIPNLGDVFQFSNQSTNESFCATHTGYSSDPGEPNIIPDEGPFGDCWECVPKDTPPRSASTESTVCVICCDCGATGSTITQVSPPHPVWTDGYGASVTQLNMITLGGNGLNS